MSKSLKKYKDYCNVQLTEKIHKYINEKTYGEYALPLIIIFERRAYEFGFSDEHILSDVRRFTRNVKKINFVSSKKLRSPKTIGVYSYKRAMIGLNKDFFLKQHKKGLSDETIGEEIFETLTHEVYHAVSDKKHSQGVSYYSGKKNGYLGIALDEAINETAANRASISRTELDVEKYRSETEGYTEITFASNLLAASVGLTEKELLKAGIQDRGKFEEAIYSKFPDDPEVRKKVDFNLRKFQAALDIIYNILYSDKKDNFKEEERVDKEMAVSSLTAMYRSALELAGEQIANDPQINLHRLYGDISYRYLKMEKIMQDTLNSYARSDIISYGDKRTILGKLKYIRSDIADRAICTGVLLDKLNRKMDYKDCIKLVESAKKGTMRKEKDILQKYSIKLPEKNSFEILCLQGTKEHKEYVFKEDFDEGRKWYNEKIFLEMKKIFDHKLRIRKKYHGKRIDENSSYNILDNIKYFFKNIKNIFIGSGKRAVPGDIMQQYKNIAVENGENTNLDDENMFSNEIEFIDLSKKDSKLKIESGRKNKKIYDEERE